MRNDASIRANLDNANVSFRALNRDLNSLQLCIVCADVRANRALLRTMNLLFHIENSNFLI